MLNRQYKLFYITHKIAEYNNDISPTHYYCIYI